MRLISDVLDLGDAPEIQLDGTCGIYKISANMVCIELYANRVVNGEVRKVVAMRCRWDRSCWLAEQEMTAKLVMEVLALRDQPQSDAVVLVH
jgi:hypothetical protein